MNTLDIVIILSVLTIVIGSMWFYFDYNSAENKLLRSSAKRYKELHLKYIEMLDQ